MRYCRFPNNSSHGFGFRALYFLNQTVSYVPDASLTKYVYVYAKQIMFGPLYVELIFNNNRNMFINVEAGVNMRIEHSPSIRGLESDKYGFTVNIGANAEYLLSHKGFTAIEIGLDFIIGKYGGAMVTAGFKLGK